MLRSPTAVRRNPNKFIDSGSEAHRTISETLPPILDKMTWGTNEVILDHGYNNGKKVLELLVPVVEKTNSTLYALDNCEAMIEFAKKNYPHARVKHIFGDMSLPEGTLRDLKFNKIFSLYAFYLTMDYRRALKSLYDHLLPGGEAFFMIPTKAHIFDLNRLLATHEKWGECAEEHLKVPDYIHDGQDQSHKFRDAFKDSDFEIREYEVKDMVYTFKNSREIADFFLSLNSFLEQMPKDLKDELEEFYYKYFLETPTELYKPSEKGKAEEGEYKFPYMCAHVLVRKPLIKK